jgi:hypothetical protein
MHFRHFCHLTVRYNRSKKQLHLQRESIPMHVFTKKRRAPERVLWLRALLMSSVVFSVTPVWSKPLPTGFYELRPYGDTITAVTKSMAWSRPDIAGVAIRVYWNSIQPSSSSAYDWSYIDAVAALAAKYGKNCSINVTGGIEAPAWVYADGPDGSGSGKFTLSGGTAHGTMPEPWDANFQRRWSAFLIELANRYDASSSLSYVIVTGQGWGGQANLCESQADNKELNNDGGVTVWIQSFISIVGLYVSHFVQTPLMVNIGAPIYPHQLGGFETASNQCVATYGNRYGIKSNALSTNFNTTNWQAAEIKALSASHPVGFQMLFPSKTRAELVQAIKTNESVGSDLFEVYPSDLDLVSNFSSL